MKILVLGSDGYIGYPLTLRLLQDGHEVSGVDNYSRRARVKWIGGNSLTPISTKLIRKEITKTGPIDCSLGVDPPGFIRSILADLKPDTIVHLAEQPSAPWSMMDAEAARITQRENVLGTLDLLWAMKKECPEAHLVKLGTMGEYGVPECDIPEGEISVDCPNPSVDNGVICPMAGLPFPRSPGSFYHLSKVHDTHNIIFACKTWGLTSTDIMQGVVFGVKVDSSESEDRLTRFDYDQYFGTVINRFCAQALIGYPLTIYGNGNQTRGFLPLRDSIQCLRIAIENPPEPGQYRTLNQFEDTYSINELANTVCKQARKLELNPSIRHLKNPRTESEDHYYNPHHQKLFDLGYRPTYNTATEILLMLKDLLPYKDRIIKEVIAPTTKWK